MVMGLPSRRTTTPAGRSSCNCKAARSARCSCTKANTALTTITTTMATPNCAMPATAASTAAAHSMRAKKWVHWPRSLRHARVTGGGGSRFGPSAMRRCAATAEVRPALVITVTRSAGESGKKSGSWSRGRYLPMIDAHQTFRVTRQPCLLVPEAGYSKWVRRFEDPRHPRSGATTVHASGVEPIDFDWRLAWVRNQRGTGTAEPSVVVMGSADVEIARKARSPV